MSARPSRTVRGWVVVTRSGWLLTHTWALLRRDAIANYGPNRIYRKDRLRYGVQVVRCSITTEGER